MQHFYEELVRLKMTQAQTYNSDLCILNSSLGATNDSLGGEQTLQELHLVQGHVSAESPQAGSLTVLVVYFQALAHKPAYTSSLKIFHLQLQISHSILYFNIKQSLTWQNRDDQKTK